MFGYVKPYKQELKLKEISKYQNAYCALCDQLKRDYGVVARIILNYDCTFIFLCLNHFHDDDKACRKIRCPLNPLRVKKTIFSQEALCYSAFINYWLVAEKLLDDYVDDKNYLKSLLRKFLISSRKFKRIKGIYEEKVNTLEALLHKVYQGENHIEDSFGFDNVTNAFGVFYSELFALENGNIETKTLLKKLFFQVGKWIYIIDAYDDFEKDVKKGKFNLLYSLAENGQMGKKEAFEKSLAIHLQLRQKINSLLKELHDTLSDDCIINILTFGLDSMFYKITEKNYKEYAGRLTQHGNDGLEQVGTKD